MLQLQTIGLFFVEHPLTLYRLIPLVCLKYKNCTNWSCRYNWIPHLWFYDCRCRCYQFPQMTRYQSPEHGELSPAIILRIISSTFFFNSHLGEESRKKTLQNATARCEAKIGITLDLAKPCNETILILKSIKIKDHNSESWQPDEHSRCSFLSSCLWDLSSSIMEE